MSKKEFDYQEYINENKFTLKKGSALNEKMSTYKSLDGARVKYSTITKDGMVNIYFDNGDILEFENSGKASIVT